MLKLPLISGNVLPELDAKRKVFFGRTYAYTFLDQHGTLFSPNAAVFSWFRQLNSWISSRNTRRWFLFLFEDNSPKNQRHELPGFFIFFVANYPLPIHCFDSSFVPRVNCFIHGYDSTQNQGLIASKHSIETSSRRCFCSILSKRFVNLVHGFLMSKFSVNTQCAALFEMSTTSRSLLVVIFNF